MVQSMDLANLENTLIMSDHQIHHSDVKIHQLVLLLSELSVTTGSFSRFSGPVMCTLLLVEDVKLCLPLSRHIM